MSILLEDGHGSGNKVRINSAGQLWTQAETHELQHHISWNDGECYQTIGRETAVAATTQTILHIANNNTLHNFVVSYIRLEIVGESGGTALPAAETYFQMGFGRTYGSGGTVTTPVNMNRTSGNVADLTCYQESPTMAGTFIEFDAWYPQSGSMMTYNKHGSMILGYNDTVEVRLISDHTAGIAFTRITGFFIEVDGS